MSCAEKVALNVVGANLYGSTFLVVFVNSAFWHKYFSHFRGTQEYKTV